MKKHFSNEKSSLVDCRENEVTPKQALRGFWDGFENYEHRYGEDELPFIYKLKGKRLLLNNIKRRIAQIVLRLAHQIRKGGPVFFSSVFRFFKV